MRLWRRASSRRRSSRRVLLLPQRHILGTPRRAPRAPGVTSRCRAGGCPCSRSLPGQGKSTSLRAACGLYRPSTAAASPGASSSPRLGHPRTARAWGRSRERFFQDPRPSYVISSVRAELSLALGEPRARGGGRSRAASRWPGSRARHRPPARPLHPRALAGTAARSRSAPTSPAARRCCYSTTTSQLDPSRETS